MPDLTAFSEEKTELKRLLASPSFLKSPNLSKLLEYLCNKHFEDCGRDLNEYSIAVEALGRTADFDPGISSIVRVEVHRLRKSSISITRARVPITPGGFCSNREVTPQCL